MNPAALSASVRIASRGIPKSSCATLPVSIAAVAAVAKAMMRTAALPMPWENSRNWSFCTSHGLRQKGRAASE
jgi:hypothetical protein